MPRQSTESLSSKAASCIAITGATGFIGRHLVRKLAASGRRLRILARHDPASALWGGIELEVVPGGLGDRAALERLVSGADTVVHLAGLIKAAGTRDFLAANRDGTRALAETVRQLAPAAHFIHVSSLAAREPRLSAYAASKRAGEDVALEFLGSRVSVVRPPAVYGPGDRETLIFFQLAARRPVWLLGGDRARTALIHVEDLAAALAILAAQEPSGGIHAIADARPRGYGWGEIMRAAAAAVGNPAPRLQRLPYAVLRAVAVGGDVGRWFGAANMLNSEKLRELLHEDWSISEVEQSPRLASWRPGYALEGGFDSAVGWYRRAGWL